MDYDDLDKMEKALNLPKGSLKSIPDYARREAANAIARVLEMERKSIFRPGLYYIVLADLVGNTQYNASYGNESADLRVQWFHTAAIQAIGEIKLSNYATFNKTIGDASLLIFSSISDVINWSNKFSDKLTKYDEEYGLLLSDMGDIPADHEIIKSSVAAFSLKARRLVHAGEVRYTNENDPLSLAVSQTFKMEKEFSEVKLGCTEIVATSIKPTLSGLKCRLQENKKIKIAGENEETMSYYIIPN